MGSGEVLSTKLRFSILTIFEGKGHRFYVAFFRCLAILYISAENRYPGMSNIHTHSTGRRCHLGFSQLEQRSRAGFKASMNRLAEKGTAISVCFFFFK